MDQTQLVTGNSTFDHVLTIVGALVPLFSALVSFFNHRVRIDSSAGKEASPTTLAVIAGLNFLSLNIDKGLQLVRMVRGQEVPTTEPKKDTDNG
jgi:hypothetical protein